MDTGKIFYNTIVTNISLGIITTFLLGKHIFDESQNLFIGIILLISIWVVFDYIRVLQNKAGVGGKQAFLGYIFFSIAGIATLFMFVY